MDVTIIYESLFGNTHKIAEAIAAGLRGSDQAARVTLVCAADAGPAGAGPQEGTGQPDLLIVGGPTHILRMTSQRSRVQGLGNTQKAAREHGREVVPEPRAEGPGVREWLDGAPAARPGSRAAAFDTRLPSRLAGGAARPIARRLRHLGYQLAAEPEGFVVTGSEGPLREGELARARAWGAALAAQPAPAGTTHR